MAKTHLHFIVWACREIEGSNYIDNVTIDLIADSEAKALERAKSLIPHKNHYSVRTVLEHFDKECK